MTNHDDERQHREELLRIHHRNARHIEKQIAQCGMAPPLHLINALDYEREQIDLLTASLGAELAAPAKQPLARPQAAPLEKPTGRLAHPMLPAPPAPPRPPGVVRRSAPSVRHLLWRTRRNAIRWWTAGGIAFALGVALVLLSLLRPAPNAALVDQLRGGSQPDALQIVQLTEAGPVPKRIEITAGEIVALTIGNETGAPQRCVIADGDQQLAAQMLASGIPEGDARIRRVTARIPPGDRLSLTFVPYRAGTFALACIPDDGTPITWGEVEALER